MKLYDKDDCPFCWKVRIALQEMKLPCEIVTLQANDDRSVLDQYSPQGTTPILVYNDMGLWESGVILEFLVDLSGGALMPSDAQGHAKARLLHVFSDKLVGEGLREVVFEKRSKPEAEWDLGRIAKGEALWRQRLDWLEAELGGREFFLGQFSVAECALYPRFALAEKFGVGVDDRHPNLKHWYGALGSRPSIAASAPKSW